MCCCALTSSDFGHAFNQWTTAPWLRAAREIYPTWVYNKNKKQNNDQRKARKAHQPQKEILVSLHIGLGVPPRLPRPTAANPFGGSWGAARVHGIKELSHLGVLQVGGALASLRRVERDLLRPVTIGCMTPWRGRRGDRLPKNIERMRLVEDLGVKKR